LSPGNVIFCEPVGGPSNGLQYDASGFLNAAFINIKGLDVGNVVSEFMDFLDQNFLAQEDLQNAGYSRHDTNGALGIQRQPLDEFVYRFPIHTATKAARAGFGPISIPK
jgi:hypothetical protein